MGTPMDYSLIENMIIQAVSCVNGLQRRLKNDAMRETRYNEKEKRFRL
jgi:hypothetical protein